MLADPQSITVGGTAKVLPRMLTGTTQGRFAGPDTTIEVETVRGKNGRYRTTARLTQRKITSDPLVATTNVEVSDTIALSFNRPLVGYSDADVLAQVKGFIAWLNANTDAVLKQIIAGEN